MLVGVWLQNVHLKTLACIYKFLYIYISDSGDKNKGSIPAEESNAP